LLWLGPDDKLFCDEPAERRRVIAVHAEPPMTDTTLKLTGNLTIAGGTIPLSVQVASGALHLQGTLPQGQSINFTQFVDHLLPAYLKLPEGFPQLDFDSATLDLVPGKTVSVEAGVAIDWKDPFGILKGVTVTQFNLTFSSGGAQDTSISFETTVDYAGQTALVGLIEFSSGTLEVVALELHQTFSIASFLDYSVPGVNWDQLLPISFGPESASQPMRLYNAEQSLGTYIKGFNVDQTVISIFDWQALVTLNVDGGDVSVTGQLKDPIDLLDLGFLYISGPDFEGSPKVSISTSPRQFTMDSSYTFLQAKFGSAKLSVQQIAGTSNYQLQATLTYDGTIGPFTNPSFSFTWSKQNGFGVDDWKPPEALTADINLLKQIKAISNANGCGAIVGLAFKAAVTTKFNVQPSFSSVGGLHISLKVSYVIYLVKQPIVSVDVPDPIIVPIKTPKTFSFASIGELLITGIEGAAESLVKCLMKDKAKAAEFFAAVVAPSVLRVRPETL
jgi:hypothetical protein